MRSLKKYFTYDYLKKKINDMQDNDMSIKAMSYAGWIEERHLYDQVQMNLKSAISMMQEQKLEEMKREHISEV